MGCVLSGISAVLGLFPYLCMWNVIRETVIGWPGGFNGDRLVRLGWLAVAYSLLSMLDVYKRQNQSSRWRLRFLKTRIMRLSNWRRSKHGGAKLRLYIENAGDYYGYAYGKKSIKRCV